MLNPVGPPCTHQMSNSYFNHETFVWLWKRFCSMFSESWSPCLLSQHGSCSTVQQPVEVSVNILQNLFHNLPPQTVCIQMDCKISSHFIKIVSAQYLFGELLLGEVSVLVIRVVSGVVEWLDVGRGYPAAPFGIHLFERGQYFINSLAAHRGL